MTITTGRTAAHMEVRPYRAADQAEVLALARADRLPGQPAVTPAMLAEALAGRSPVDSDWWAELDPPRTDVAHAPGGGMLGAVSYATRREDGAGLVLWLHCREDRAVADALLAHALTVLGPRTVYAFEFASALTRGLEGLPVRARPVTREALEAAGFVGRDLWRYIRRPLPQSLPQVAADRGAFPAPVVAEVSESADPPGWRLALRETDGAQVAEATVGRPESGTGVLWWIGTEPAHRGRGLGRRLLDQCFGLLAEHGGREMIAFVDDDAPPGDPERDRTAANRLYDRAGFTEVDRLWSFTRHR